jgi:chemotaxis protein methyltransferase CheR
MNADLQSFELSPAEFEKISQTIYRLCGICLAPGKEGLVKTRLSKRLRALGLGGVKEYLEYVERDSSQKERATMIDLLTTNKTSFFRESQHFDFLCQRVLPGLQATNRPVRFWSAGCSSGEEPYSLAILLHEHLPDMERRDARILATDISARMLTKAREAIYDEDVVSDLPSLLLRQYFVCVRTQPTRAYRVSDKVRALVRFARLNLMEAWPMKGPFDAIFCRNVMIYFDKPTRQRLVQRYYELLMPGGHLFVGHSESLTALSHSFRYVQPAVYVK